MGEDALPTSGNFDVYASLAAAEAGQSTSVKPARAIRCGTSGTLRVKRCAGAAVVDLPFAAGETQAVQVTSIVATGSSGCVPITVYR